MLKTIYILGLVVWAFLSYHDFSNGNALMVIVDLIGFGVMGLSLHREFKN